MYKVYEQTYQGLKIICIEQNSFSKSYAGIGVKFGGVDPLNESTQASGLAHFIEHKLFQMPTGDAFEEFTRMHAKANAYTTIDKTIYYFTTILSIYPPLQLLLNMYFTPYFKKEDVEKEKGIILSEIEDTFDDIQTKFAMDMMKQLYPKDPFSLSVVGDASSVKNMEKKNLIEGYKRYYTTDNSILVIVTNESHQKIFNYVKEVLKSLTLMNGTINRSPMVLSKTAGKSFKYEHTISQTMVSIGIRFSGIKGSTLFCNALMAILDSLFSPVSKFYQHLSQKKTFYADIDYMIHNSKDASYAMITTYSSIPDLFIKEVIEKLKNLSIEDLDEKLIMLTIKFLKAKYITNLDDVETLGDEILGLALEDLSYFDEEKECWSLTYDKIKDYIACFKDAIYIHGICQKK